MESTTISSSTLPPTTTTETDFFTTETPLADAMHQQHKQITFEIPTHQDLEHIYHMNKLQALLQRIGDVPSVSSAYSSSHVYNVNRGDYAASGAAASAAAAYMPIDSAGNHITNEQIAKSVVLDLADLKAHSGNGWLESLFDGVDMHTIINYVWIAVVTSLIVLSLIFILFSFYFYRKFRVWKKCNKDIRAHLNTDLCPSNGAHSSSTTATGTCSAAHTLHHHQTHHCHSQRHQQTAAAAAAQYYQVESPPCYTIATGLPTYDEALHHNNQHQHFAYGMKFVYPNIVAVHHPFVEAQKEETMMTMAVAAAAAAASVTGKRKDTQEKLYSCNINISNSNSNGQQNSAAALEVPLLSAKCPETRLSIDEYDDEDDNDNGAAAKCTDVFVV